MATNTDLQSLVTSFVLQLVSVVEVATTDRIQAALAQALGAPAKRGPGRPPKNVAAAPVVPAPAKPRKKPPKQLCPVPGCKNPAAPVFGMVCAKHKDLPKAKIRKFREARKAKKLGLKSSKVAKRRKRKAQVRASKPPKTTAALQPAPASATA